MSDFLFSVPSAVDGIASVIDLFGIYPEYNDSRDSKAADTRAFRADIMALQTDADIAFSTIKDNAER